MKIQENMNAVWDTEAARSTDSLNAAPKSEMQTESVHADAGAVYEKTEAPECKYATYNADGVVNAVSPASASSSNRSIQIALMELGFYTEKIDGNITSASMKKAIGNFQTVYGLTKTGTMDQDTKSKLDLVSSFRNRAASIVSQYQGTDVIKDLDSVEKQNFANIWTFLRLEMEIDAAHAAAVMGNIKAESWFSSNNLENENDVTHHDPNYKYEIYDGKGYGILQWTHWQRKEGLKNEADAMGLQPGDLNAQLAYFRTEMTSNMFYQREWTNFNSIKTLSSATDYFLNYIEMPSDKEIAESKEERREYANQIYQLMYKL